MFDGKFNSNQSKERKPFNLNRSWLGIAGLVLLAAVIVLASIFVVPSGNVGVVTRFGAVSRQANPGMNLRIPFAEGVVLMNVRTQKDEVPATAMSKNLQVVTSAIAVNYHLDATKALQVFQDIGPNYADIIVAPAIQNTFKAVTARFTAEELITDRDVVRMEAEDELAKQLSGYNIIVENFNIVNFDFSSEYQAAIESKQVAQQQVETSKQKLAQAEIDAQAVVAAAQGQADAQKALRDTGALTQEYLNYLFLTKWNGTLPQVMGGATPMIDVSQYLPGADTP